MESSCNRSCNRGRNYRFNSPQINPPSCVPAVSPPESATLPTATARPVKAVGCEDQAVAFTISLPATRGIRYGTNLTLFPGWASSAGQV